MISAIKTVRETWPGPQERRHWLARLREHPTPTMILWGEKDRVNVLEPNSGWNELIPDSELFLNSDSGHWPALETPEWVEVKIREFLFRVNLQFSRSLKAVS